MNNENELKIIADLLVGYSEYLEVNGYLDSDWRDEEPNPVDRYLGDLRNPKPIKEIPGFEGTLERLDELSTEYALLKGLGSMDREQIKRLEQLDKLIRKEER